MKEGQRQEEMWDFYLAKVWGQTFTEYKEQVKQINDYQNLTLNETAGIVNDSWRILKGFNPSEE